MMPLHRNDPRVAAIEPQAINELAEGFETFITDEHVQFSIAISLKRLADAVAGDDQNTGIHLALLQLLDGKP